MTKEIWKIYQHDGLEHQQELWILVWAFFMLNWVPCKVQQRDDVTKADSSVAGALPRRDHLVQSSANNFSLCMHLLSKLWSDTNTHLILHPYFSRQYSETIKQGMSLGTDKGHGPGFSRQCWWSLCSRPRHTLPAVQYNVARKTTGRSSPYCRAFAGSLWGQALSISGPNILLSKYSCHLHVPDPCPFLCRAT